MYLFLKRCKIPWKKKIMVTSIFILNNVFKSFAAGSLNCLSFDHSGLVVGEYASCARGRGLRQTKIFKTASNGFPPLALRSMVIAL